MKYILTIVLLAGNAGAVSWLSGIVYDQNDNTITLTTTGDTSCKVGIAAASDDVAADRVPLEAAPVTEEKLD